MIAILTGPGAETLRLDVYPEPRRQTGALRFDVFPDTEADRKALRAVADAIEGDVFFLETLPSLKTIRHAFFDMDSTLIDNECIDDMAACFGVGEQVADITRRAVELFTAVAGDRLENAMATGDGANDLLMVRAAGLGVAYHAKAVLTQAADVAVRKGGLDTLVHLFEESWYNA